MSCYITYKGKNYTQEDFLDYLKSLLPTSSTSNNPTEFTNHSGGAKGGDMQGWDAIGREFGVTNHNHYTVAYYDKLAEQEKTELNKQYLETVRFLGRGVISKDTYAGKLVRRDMIQANNGESIYGVTELIKPGVKGRKGYNNKMSYSIPEGGTGYATARGILLNKPTYVFNQSDKYGNEIGWYKWDNNVKDFIKTDTPILSKNFTGIGSQEINELGLQAIRDVYEKTFNAPNSTISNNKKGFKLSIDKKGKDQGKADLANALITYPNSGTSSYQYMQDARKQGIPVNGEIKAGSNIVAMVSVNGNNRATDKQIEDTYLQAREIIEAGGTVIMDSTQDANRSWNISGEALVQEQLGKPTGQTSKGYNYWGPNPESISYYEGDIVPEPNTIFVFGSNPEGRHGAGAAKVAKDKFGAIYGQGEGLQGNAYALPTKDLRVKENRGFKSISPEQITESIKKLYEVAKQNPDKQFKIAYRNTDTTSLNGYTGIEMIEMFKQAGPIPSNIIFSKEWYDAMSKETSSQVGQTSDNETSTDTYQYYGAKYEIITVGGVGVQVKNYKGSHQNQQKLLQAYNNNKDVDPQTGRKFRNLSPLEELEQKITGGTSDTLNLSKYELFPGVYANEGQRAAIDAIEEFFAGDKDQFLLKGRGGTGKTTIVKKTLEQFNKSGVKILGSTISYEAKNVLQDNMQGYKTATLASVLGLIPDYAKDGSMFFREKTLEERMNNSGLITPLPIETVDILIVDEASMIDEFIYNKLLELKKPRTKILFMGDNVQIPPINSRTDEEGNVIEGENSDSPVWQLIDSGDYVELSERMRQGAESPILPITDLYAKNVEEIQSGETGLKNPLTDRTSNFQNNEGVLFTSDVNEVVNQFVEDIEGSTDIREAVIVGARNAVVDDMNLRVRKKLFETKEPFVIGDSIRINSPHVENNEVIFENGLRAKVKDVYELPEDNLGLKRYELEIEYIETNEKGDKFIRKAFLKTISPQDQKQYKNKLREMAARAKSFVPKTPESKKAWKEFFDIKSSTVDVGYGYAITSHKVQGSTYNSAYVLEGDIMSFPGGIEQTNRMMYTAVSRPRKKLVIFNPSVVESQQVSQPTKVDIRAKVYELFNLQGYMDIKTSHKTDKNLITAISHYVLEDLGYKTDQEKLQAVREGFKLSEYITTEQISDVHTRVRLNMKNIIEDEVDDGPVSLGGIKFTSSGYESEAENAFKTPTLDLSTKVTSFLETLNFEINTFENLKEVTGYDAEAATDLLYKMVLLKNTNKIENNLVKEAAYVAISLLGKKNKTRTDLLHSIDQLDNYPKLYEQYKKRSPDLNDYKIKELILVDLVADSIYKNYNTPKDSYINRKSEYWSITGSSKFEKKFKYYISRIKRILEDFFGTNKLSSEEFNDLLSDISKDILDNNTYKFNVDLSPKEQLTNYEETIKEDKGAENIIKTFQDLGLYLTGSLAIRKQGSLYRDTKENLHDLDFTVPAEKSSEEIQKILDSIKLPRLPFIEDLVSPEDIEEYKLEQLTKHLHEIDLIKDIKKKYPTYKVETIFKGLNPGEFSIIGKIDDYAIDLFLVSNTEVSDSNSLGFQNWQDIFLAKLKMGRHKDIKDLVNFKAYNKNLNTKLAQTKGVRHFNFKNDNTIEQAFTCK